MTRCLLAIETSCDETAAAVISETFEVRSSVVPERSALTMASSIVKWMFRRELYRALS